jgi:ABC transport system ATP-binding/permease protein
MLGIDRRQAGILADRYVDVMLGDLGATLLLIIQAPLIAVLIAGVWANASGDTQTMYFVLCLSAFFFGAINSSREIVKERALLQRERMFGLSLSAYLISKFRVLSILAIIQCAILVIVVRAMVPMRINVVPVAIVLILTAIAGTGVGLMISALVSTSDKAVAAVPLIVIPQLLFSDFVLGEGQLSNWTGRASLLMPVRWSYDILNALYGSSWELAAVLSDAIVVLAMIFGSYLVALLLLQRRES